jgi:UDP-glucose 4-epimerase
LGEESPLRPISAYGSSKLAAERMIQDYAASSDFRYATLRYFNVAGADPEARVGPLGEHADHLITTLCRTILGHREGFMINGDDYPTSDGTAERDYIHILDLAEAHICALNHLMAGGESLTLNCGYGHGTSVSAVLAEARRVSGAEIPATIGPRRPGDAMRAVADCALIKKRLGWQPRHDDLAAMIKTALAWEAIRTEKMAMAETQELKPSRTAAGAV